MNEQVKVSVVIPVYNVERYLRQCLESILPQTLQEIEIICVNDGSTDGSLKLLKEFRDNYSKIIVVNQDNQGAGPARNHGIGIAKGKYVAFIDPDDYYASNTALATLYAFAEQNNVMICCGNMKNSDGEYVRKRFLKNERVVFTDLRNCGAHVCNIYNLDFLKRSKIYYPSYRRFQDPPFLAKAMIVAKEFFAVNTDVYVYRTNHKTLHYNEDVTINVISGINDILNTVKEHHFGLEFPKQVLAENRMDILRHSIEGTERVLAALGELNMTISDVLGEQYAITKVEIEKYQKECGEIYEAIKNKSPIIIYGAGEIGRAAVQTIDKMNGKIAGIAVSGIESNPKVVGEYAVNTIEYYAAGYNRATTVLIAVGQKSRDEVLKNVYEHDFVNAYIWDSTKIDFIENVLMKEK